MERLNKLSKRLQAKLLTEAENMLLSWGEAGTPEIIWDGRSHIAQLHDDCESELCLYRCECGNYLAGFEDMEDSLMECKCGRSF